jgi:hypothetical protein
MRSPDSARTTSATLLPWLTWRYSAILAVALIALVGTLVYVSLRHDRPIELVVQDDHGVPLANASVIIQDATFLTDAEGIVRLAATDSLQNVTVERDGYVSMVGQIHKDSARNQTVTLERQASKIASTQTTVSMGTPQLMTAQTPATVGATTSAPATPTPQHATHEIAGKITDASGTPIRNAWVAAGDTYVFTSNDGVFLFDSGKVDAVEKLRVFASGYRELVLPAPTNGDPLHVTLELQPIKAIYFNPNISTTEEDVDRLINLINTTELNAIVIDIKEELVFYDTQVGFFREAGTVRPIIDLPALLKKMQDNNIYTIARLVVFKDGLVAEKYNYLGVHDTVTGNLWRDQNGVAWVNPMMHDLWHVNLDLAYEAATLGFDEIQYDYVRFPTDGDVSRAEFGLENTQDARQRSIETFLEMSHQKLIPTGVKLSADVFGYTVIVDDDLGIGQNFAQLGQYVDYLSPMIYPSHWPNGSLGLNGHPNDFPYETVEISMNAATAKLDGNSLKIRPWLQDFSFPGLTPYGDAEVRAQIDAAEATGMSGWMLWDPNNWYHAGALKPEAPSTAASTTPRAIIDRVRTTASIRRNP